MPSKPRISPMPARTASRSSSTSRVNTGGYHFKIRRDEQKVGDAVPSGGVACPAFQRVRRRRLPRQYGIYRRNRIGVVGNVGKR